MQSIPFSRNREEILTNKRTNDKKKSSRIGYTTKLIN